MSATKTGIETLRTVVTLFDNCREDFNARFSVRQLLALAQAYLASGWDFPPDRWTERQVQEALRGKVPRWDDQEQPCYDEVAR